MLFFIAVGVYALSKERNIHMAPQMQFSLLFFKQM